MSFRAEGSEGQLLPKERRLARCAARIAAMVGTFGLVAWSAVLAKEAGNAPALLAMSALHRGEVQTDADVPSVDLDAPLVRSSQPPDPKPESEDPVIGNPFPDDPSVRWFNGRPIRPSRTMWMKVTAYSPDARSCGDSADGITATLHSVETNGFRLVAADPKVLKYGSMISVPGYDSGLVVPVLDCGSAIKGNRLDVIFPTHEQARAWGVRRLAITVWKYADDKPAENPRKLR